MIIYALDQPNIDTEVDTFEIIFYTTRKKWHNTSNDYKTMHFTNDNDRSAMISIYQERVPWYDACVERQCLIDSKLFVRLSQFVVCKRGPHFDNCTNNLASITQHAYIIR